MTRYLIAVAMLVLIFALTLASFDPWDLVIGLIISIAVLELFRPILQSQRLTRGGRSAPSPWRRVVGFPPFVAAVFWEVIVGTWQVALITLHIKPITNPGIITVPIGDRTPIGVAVFGITTTLAPGTLVLDIDWRNRVMVIHAIDASDPDGFRVAQARFYDRWQRHVFP